VQGDNPRFVFRYDRIDQPIAEENFAIPQVPGLQPAPVDALDGNYTARFLNALDGSSGSMSVRWGKVGPAGRSSSGLN
jgi:hypothetical protein